MDKEFLESIEELKKLPLSENTKDAIQSLVGSINEPDFKQCIVLCIASLYATTDLTRKFIERHSEIDHRTDLERARDFEKYCKENKEELKKKWEGKNE